MVGWEGEEKEEEEEREKEDEEQHEEGDEEEGTMAQNNQESRCEYWARSLVRSLIRSHRSLRSLSCLLESECLMSQNDLVFSHSAAVIRGDKALVL